MVGGACSAKTAAAGGDCAVGQQDTDAVVVPWNSDGRELSEGVGGGVEELGGELRGVVAEGLGGDLAANNEDCAVRHNDRVGECACECHVTDGGDDGHGRWRTKGDDVRV